MEAIIVSLKENKKCSYICAKYTNYVNKAFFGCKMKYGVRVKHFLLMNKSTEGL